MDDLWTMQQVADYLGVTYMTVYRWTRGNSPRLNPARVDRSPFRTKAVYFNRADVERLKRGDANAGADRADA